MSGASFAYDYQGLHQRTQSGCSGALPVTSLAGTAGTCAAPSAAAQDQQAPPSLLLCSLMREGKVHLHSLSGALGHHPFHNPSDTK